MGQANSSDSIRDVSVQEAAFRAYAGQIIARHLLFHCADFGLPASVALGQVCRVSRGMQREERRSLVVSDDNIDERIRAAGEALERMEEALDHLHGEIETFKQTL